MSKKENLSTTLPQNYLEILESLRSKIKSAQTRALGAVNQELVNVYREVGKTIYEQQQVGRWGDAVVKTLAFDLQNAFPGMRGFSYRNLYAMRDLYLEYKNSKKLQTLSAQIEIEGQEFFIDLLFYHRSLKSLIAVELKVSEFTPNYISKMQFYLPVLDDTVRLEGENPSIGIILCKSKKRNVVEYALRDASKPINVASYQLVNKLPEELAKELPSVKQMEKLLENID